MERDVSFDLSLTRRRVLRGIGAAGTAAAGLSAAGTAAAAGTDVCDGGDWYVWSGEAVWHSESITYEDADSLAISISDTTSTGWAAARRDYPDGVDLSGAGFSTAVYWDGLADGWHTLGFRVADGEGNWRVYTAPVLADGLWRTWHRVNFQPDSESATPPDLSNVVTVQFSYWVGPNVDAVVYLDDLRTSAGPDRGRVAFTLDDSRDTHYTEAFPVMDDEGVPATTAVMADDIGSDGYMTLEQLREVYDAGWAVSAHPQEPSPLPAFSEDEQRDLMERNRQWLLDRGFTRGADTIVYPYGAVGPATLNVAGDLFDRGFYATGGTTPTVPGEPLTINRVDAGPSVEAAKAAIDEAEAYGMTATLMYHTFGPNGETPATDLREVCRYAKSADVDVVTLDEW